jgi:hypothetical protein
MNIFQLIFSCQIFICYVLCCSMVPLVIKYLTFLVVLYLGINGGFKSQFLEPRILTQLTMTK